MARLKEFYKKDIIPIMIKKFAYTSVMAVPKLKKITLNMGVGEAVNDKKVMNFAIQDMSLISGQMPIVTKAKKSIASFKIREDWPVGCKVTLRNARMYEFLDRLINIVLPRVRDFRGLNTHAFDGTGNYNLGIQEQIVFPEIDLDKTDGIRGLDISITTSAKTNAEAKALLELFNLPLKDRKNINY